MSFGFTPPEVDQSAFDDGQRQSYPSIVWHGRFQQGMTAGYFTTDRENFTEAPEMWAAHEVQFGTDPTSPIVPVWYTYRMRCAVLAERFRWQVNGDDGQRYYYPKYTKKTDRMPGDVSSHIQVLVVLPDAPEQLMVLGLRGYSKSMAWENDGKNRTFPKGVKVMAAEYASEATNAVREKGYSGPPLPWQCMFWLDFVPHTAIKDGKKKPEAVWTHVGHETHMNQFVLDTTCGGKAGGFDLPKTRYVGDELYKQFQEMRISVGLDWEAEWSQKSSEAAPDDGGAFGSNIIPDEDDNSIPF